ncbi:hypothetical protein AM1_4927 [Acaryochloris marina MBIC11017]|uniref:Uncharacterized protein n=2 Tax=Acaryochloris marina TaxID=155978 RepID=B0C4L5_ACAM1|nr:hypothetical protein AM1_4927 [Acaryochloris marina MBIC11017]
MFWIVMSDSRPFDLCALTAEEQLFLSQKAYPTLETSLNKDWIALERNPERALAYGWGFVENTPRFLRWEERNFTDKLQKVRMLIDRIVVSTDVSKPWAAEAVS